MELLEGLRAKMTGYGGYTDEATRLRSDQLVRAYAGERLALLRARIGGDCGQQERETLDTLVTRCEFGNQALLQNLETLPPDAVSSLMAADAALAELSDRADGIAAEQLEHYLHDVTAAVDARDAALAPHRA